MRAMTYDIYHKMKDAGIVMPDNVINIDIHIGVDCVPTITYETSVDMNTMETVIDALADRVDGLEVKTSEGNDDI